MEISIAIPTYRRDQVLLDSLAEILRLDPPAAEVLVLDQSEAHAPHTERRLQEWTTEGCIRWVRLPKPSIPSAMNWALAEASREVILFLDDDIVPERSLVAAHRQAHERTAAALIAGRILQPWPERARPARLNELSFASTRPAWIEEFMAGNFSVHRDVALALGGFDENFVEVAYNFEAEFAYRLRRAHHRIYFEPAACIHHLKADSGGTRAFGDHLRNYWPSHSVGAYYYHLRTWSGWPSLAALLSRPLRAIANRHHLTHPWWIPATAVAELSGMIWAFVLALRGPRYIDTKQTVPHKC